MKKISLLLVVVLMALISASCGKKSVAPIVIGPTIAATQAPTQAPTATATATLVPTATVVLEPTPTLAPTATAALEPTVIPTEETIWMQVQVGKFSEGYQADGKTWELPLGTFFAVTTKNGRYEAVESAPVGVVGNTDFGWCDDAQLDCPPHALLVLVEVPQESVSCFTAQMDISWRIQFANTCEQPVPVRVSVRYNDQTRSASELKEDYLALAGLTQQVQNATSEVGLFVSVKQTGTSELSYMNNVVPFGYSCWDCLADTQGAGEPVPVPLTGITTFGTPTAPLGSSLLPGVVFPLPRPDDGSTYVLSFEMNVIDLSVIWTGRYDVPFLTPTATP